MEAWKELFVSKKNDQDFTCIADALEAAKRYATDEVIIHVGEGVYRERVVINQDHITLIGVEGKTQIIYGDYAYEILPDGMKRGTFRTPTLFIDADDVKLQNINVTNDAGQGDQVGQAIAVYADKQKSTVEVGYFNHKNITSKLTNYKNITLKLTHSDEGENLPPIQL